MPSWNIQTGDRGDPAPWQESVATMSAPIPRETNQERQQVAAKVLRAAPAGVVPIRFSIGNLQGTASEQMYRVIAVDASTAQGAAIGVPLVSRGSIVAMTVASDETRTSGTATFQALINGSGGAQLEWDQGSNETQVFNAGDFPFTTGDVLTVNVTTQDFSPTGCNVEVVVYVVQTQ